MTIRTLFLALSLACVPAVADTLQVTLDFPEIPATPGQLITFSGIIQNTDQEIVDLNSISVSLDGMFMVDTSPFLLGPATVAGNSQTSDFDLFTVTVASPYTDPAGVVGGTVTILGGIEGVNGYDPSVQDDLGGASFSVDVTQSSAPEPSSLVLLLTGVALIGVHRVLGRRGRSAGRTKATSL